MVLTITKRRSKVKKIERIGRRNEKKKPHYHEIDTGEIEKNAAELGSRVQKTVDDAKQAASQAQEKAGDQIERGKEAANNTAAEARGYVDAAKTKAGDQLQRGKEALDDTAAEAKGYVDAAKAAAGDKLAQGKEAVSDTAALARGYVDAAKTRANDAIETLTGNAQDSQDKPRK